MSILYVNLKITKVKLKTEFSKLTEKKLYDNLISTIKEEDKFLSIRKDAEYQIIDLNNGINIKRINTGKIINLSKDELIEVFTFIKKYEFNTNSLKKEKLVLYKQSPTCAIIKNYGFFI